MIHPVLRLVATEPHLIAEHAEAYAALIGDELKKTAAAWKSRLIFGAAAAAFGIFGLLFAGIALIAFGASADGDELRHAWLLFVVPGIPIVLAIVCLVLAMKKTPDVFADIRHQVAADLALLREVSTSSKVASS